MGHRTGCLCRECHALFMGRSRGGLESAYKSAMGDWIREAGPWDYFATLTFDPWDVSAPVPQGKRSLRGSRPGRERITRPADAVPPAVSLWCAERRFRRFLGRAEGAVGRQVEGVVAMELHKSGQPHGHGLLRMEGGAVQGDVVALKRDWQGLPGNGYIRLEVPRSMDDVAGYCAKYMTKDLGHLVFSRGFGGKR